jgi:type VI secretion system FHA domain protein
MTPGVGYGAPSGYGPAGGAGYGVNGGATAQPMPPGGPAPGGWGAPPGQGAGPGSGNAGYGYGGGSWGAPPPTRQGGSATPTGHVSSPIPTQGSQASALPGQVSGGWGSPAPTASPGPAAAPPHGATPTPAPAPAPTPTPAQAPGPAAGYPPDHATPNSAPAMPGLPAGASFPPAGPSQDPSAAAIVTGLATGLGIDESALKGHDPGQIGFVLGRCLSICTADVMQLLQDRGSVKSNVVRLERTVYGTEDDNPLKFASDAAAAIEGILAATGRDGSNGASYYSDALKDLRLHQAALISAIQKALLELFEDLSPDAIEDAAGRSAFRLGKGRLWEDYCDRWDALQDRPNGILDAFLDLYAKHYKAAVEGGGK